MTTNTASQTTPSVRRPKAPQSLAAAAIGDSLLDVNAATSILGSRETKFRDDVLKGLLTRPIKRGARWARWPAAEIIAINKARIAGRRDDEIRALVKALEAARASADHESMACEAQ